AASAVPPVRVNPYCQHASCLSCRLRRRRGARGRRPGGATARPVGCQGASLLWRRGTRGRAWPHPLEPVQVTPRLSSLAVRLSAELRRQVLKIVTGDDLHLG